MPEQDCSRGYADVSRFRGLDHRDDDGAGLVALEFGGSTVFDDGAARRCHSNVSAMSPTLSPKEVFENYGLKPNHLAQLRYQKKGPRYIQATPRTVLYRQSDIEDWLTANTVETEDSKEMKKASAATDAEIK